MGLQSLKVTTKALQQVEEILETSPNAKETLETTIIEAIDRLYNRTISQTPQLLLVDDEKFTVAPKAEHKAFMADITGKKGPYQVVKTYKSWVGMSDGVYQIEDCDKFVPVSWFEKQAARNNRLQVLSVLLAISSILQTGLLFLLIL
jgi:hypothetical protein